MIFTLPVVGEAVSCVAVSSVDNCVVRISCSVDFAHGVVSVLTGRGVVVETLGGIDSVVTGETLVPFFDLVLCSYSCVVKGCEVDDIGPLLLKMCSRVDCVGCVVVLELIIDVDCVGCVVAPEVNVDGEFVTVVSWADVRVGWETGCFDDELVDVLLVFVVVVVVVVVSVVEEIRGVTVVDGRRRGVVLWYLLVDDAPQQSCHGQHLVVER